MDDKQFLCGTWLAERCLIIDRDGKIMKNSEKMELFQALSDSDIEKRRNAILKLGKLRDPHIFKILASHFFDIPPAIRDALFQVFTSFKERWVAEIVADTLLSNNLSARSLAIDILREIGEEAVWPLKRLLKNSNPVIRKIAAEILGRIPSRRVGEILLAHIDETDESVLFAIIEALGCAKEIKAFPYFVHYYQIYPTLRANILSSALHIIQHWQEQLLTSNGMEEDELLLMVFLGAIRKSGNMFAFNRCVEVLKKHPNPQVKKESIRTLISLLKRNSYLTLPQSMYEIVESFKKDLAKEGEFENYLIICSRIGSPACFEILLEAFRDSAWHRMSKLLLVDFINLFPEIFVDSYLKIPEVVRLPLLENLVEQQDLSITSSMDQLLIHALSPKEKLFLTQLLARTQKPQYIQLFVKEIQQSDLSVKDRFNLTAPLKHENFLSIYMNIFLHQSGEIQKRARDVLNSLGVTIAPFLLEKLKKKNVSEWPYFLYLIAQLNEKIQFEFWKIFLKEVSKRDWNWMKHFIKETRPRHLIPMMLLSLCDVEDLFEDVVQFLKTQQIEVVRTQNFDEYLETFSIQIQKKITTVLNELGNFQEKSRTYGDISRDTISDYLEAKV